MPTLTSPDGTTIAYESTGAGPTVILVDGAMCYRAAGPMRPLAALLAQHFTVVTYDRRGRGESTDTAPYAVAREVEDLRSLIRAVGGQAHVYTMSSGGALGLATAAADAGVTRLALYEPPYASEVQGGTRFAHYTERLTGALAEGRHGDAVALFMDNVGVPSQAIDAMRSQPGWTSLEAIAPTLAYDDALLAGGYVPRHLAEALTLPMIVLSGAASPEVLRQAAEATAGALAGADLRVLAGQTHDVDPAAVTPVLVDFFSTPGGRDPVDRLTPAGPVGAPVPS